MEAPAETLQPLKKRSILDDDSARVTYYPNVFSASEARRYHSTLKDTLQFAEQQVTLVDKVFTVQRRVVLYGDVDSESAREWTPELLEIKQVVENITGDQYNFVVCNLYRDGNDYIGPHSDKEGTHAPGSNIASVSLGAERDFVLQPISRTRTKKTLTLESGSLLVMGGNTQKNWKHGVPKRKRCTSSRINLTFRISPTE